MSNTGLGCFLFCFSSQTVATNGYYGIETHLPYICNLKLDRFIVAGHLKFKLNTAVVLCNLTTLFVLKHTTTIL